jgi:uncharacterized protein YccT (UPF0319 family)
MEGGVASEMIHSWYSEKDPETENRFVPLAAVQHPLLRAAAAEWK